MSYNAQGKFIWNEKPSVSERKHKSKKSLLVEAGELLVKKVMPKRRASPAEEQAWVQALEEEKKRVAEAEERWRIEFDQQRALLEQAKRAKIAEEIKLKEEKKAQRAAYAEARRVEVKAQTELRKLRAEERIALEEKRLADEPDINKLVHQLPVASDPRWKKWCVGLHDFLTTPRTMSELNSWASANRYDSFTMRQMLAWLSLYNHASVLRKGKTIFWTSRRIHGL